MPMEQSIQIRIGRRDIEEKMMCFTGRMCSIVLSEIGTISEELW